MDCNNNAWKRIAEMELEEDKIHVWGNFVAGVFKITPQHLILFYIHCSAV